MYNKPKYNTPYIWYNNEINNKLNPTTNMFSNLTE